MFFGNEADRILRQFLSSPFFGPELDGCVGGTCGHHGSEQPGTRYYGYVTAMDPDGRRVIREYGDPETMRQKRTHTDGGAADGSRQSLVDTVIDEKQKVVKMAAEMPGVNKEDIKIAVEGRHVSVRAEGENGRKYDTRVPLERKVNPDSGKAIYRNGILEITFGLAEEKNRGKSVRVE